MISKSFIHEEQIETAIADEGSNSLYFSGKHYIYCLKSQVIVTIKSIVMQIITSKGIYYYLFDESI